MSAFGEGVEWPGQCGSFLCPLQLPGNPRGERPPPSWRRQQKRFFSRDGSGSEGTEWGLGERVHGGLVRSGSNREWSLQQGAWAAHQSLGAYGGSCYYLMCYNKPEKITKGKIQFLLPAFIIENPIYLHNKATVSRAYLEGNLLSFITPAIRVLKAKADSLWGRLVILLQSYAS